MKLKGACTDLVDRYLYRLSVLHKAQEKGSASGLLKPMLEFCGLENEPYPDTYFDFPVDMPEN